MRKKIIVILLGSIPLAVQAQDSLKTTTLHEVVVTGTKFDLPVEKSGKTIFKLTTADLEKNAGKSLGDVLNEVPGLQIDGNLGTPGSNISYFLRGGRNRHTLILIDGVPLNDPSAINAEYDLRFIPTSQIESIEVLKGGLSTLHGTGAAAGVINIRLKKPSEKFQGSLEVETASYATQSINKQVSGSTGKLSYLASAGVVISDGFSSAKDEDETNAFDRDGFERLNWMSKIGYQFTDAFKVNFHNAVEFFSADYDAYEFTDAPNNQEYLQLRLGSDATFTYKRGTIEGKLFTNWIKREYENNYPADHNGTNVQGEVVHRHKFSDVLQTLAGINVQYMSFKEKSSFSTVGSDSAHARTIDPYISLLLSMPSGFNLHAGLRLNTHDIYGEKVVYNFNPSFVFNQSGRWHYKIYGSLSTSYITPSLYQLFSMYGNKDIKPEESFNIEGGVSVYHQSLELTTTFFKRDETNPIDFFSIYDDEGNWLGSAYQNFTTERIVSGIEFSGRYQVNEWVDLNANYTIMKADDEPGFYRIPKEKYGAAIIIKPSAPTTFSVKYNYVGNRKTYDYTNSSEVTLKAYSVVDLFVSYSLMKNKLNIYGSVNNFFDKDFVAVYGYTTRGRNFALGARFKY